SEKQSILTEKLDYLDRQTSPEAARVCDQESMRLHSSSNTLLSETLKSETVVNNKKHFLMGLRDVFNSVRSIILTTEPIPDVKSAFATLSRDASHRKSHSPSKNVKAGPSAFAFAARPSNATAPIADLPVVHDDTPLIPTDAPTISPIVPTIPSIAPTIQYTSPFVCTDSFDSDTPDTPPSQDPYEILLAPPGLPRRLAFLVLPRQPILVGRPYYTQPNGVLKMLTARKRVGPLPTHRLALIYSADYSSSDHFTSDDSSRDSPSDPSLETSSDSHSDTSSDSSSRQSSLGHSISDSPWDTPTAT
ncbi:hypothetical protein Tco_0809599, partial [Tanacetum coccineum]